MGNWRRNFMKKRIAGVLAALMLMPNIVLGAAVPEEKTPKVDFNFLYSTYQIINNKYPFELDQDKIIKGAVKGMLESVDENSSYYTKEEAENFNTLTEGETVGVGMVMTFENGKVRVSELMENHPAITSGLKINDEIIAVDGVSINGKTLTQVSAAIKGEVGTNVKIKVRRDGKDFEYEIKREKIEINPVKTKVLEGNIGYISINEFSYGMADIIKDELTVMDKKGVKSIVIDLRNNPGGLLSEATNMANLFIPAGDVVHIRYKNEFETIKSNLEKQKYKIAVLVNGGSASASEIFAGAVQDRKAGTIIGTQTYGKGTVQSLMPITDGSLVKLTIAEYLTPSKRSINKKGITPDIVVENTNVNVDLQLRKAMEILSK